MSAPSHDEPDVCSSFHSRCQEWVRNEISSCPDVNMSSLLTPEIQSHTQTCVPQEWPSGVGGTQQSHHISNKVVFFDLISFFKLQVFQPLMPSFSPSEFLGSLSGSRRAVRIGSSCSLQWPWPHGAAFAVAAAGFLDNEELPLVSACWWPCYTFSVLQQVNASVEMAFSFMTSNCDGTANLCAPCEKSGSEQA